MKPEDTKQDPRCERPALRRAGVDRPRRATSRALGREQGAHPLSLRHQGRAARRSSTATTSAHGRALAAMARARSPRSRRKISSTPTPTSCEEPHVLEHRPAEVASGHHVEKIVRRTLPVFRLGTTWLGQIAPDAPAGSTGSRAHQRLRHGRHLLHVRPCAHQLNGVDPFSPDALEGASATSAASSLSFSASSAPARNPPRKIDMASLHPRTPRKNNGS